MNSWEVDISFYTASPKTLAPSAGVSDSQTVVTETTADVGM